MLNGNIYYHGAIKRAIVAFGRLFSDIKIERYNNSGVVEQVLAIPLSYAPKEKWITRLEADPNLNNNVYTTLPRLSFEITGYAYDANRKTNKMNKIVNKDSITSNNPKMKTVLAPVPYNIDISLYILTKNTEDALQILEQILPTFTPEYSIAINAIPELEIVQDIPIILNSVTVQDDYDGDFQTRRFVTHTLNFTLKTNIFGNVNNQGIIKTVIANVTEPGRKYEATAVTPTTIPTESWEDVF